MSQNDFMSCENLLENWKKKDVEITSKGCNI